MTVSRFRTILYTVVAIVAVGGLADATYLSVQALTGETLSCGGSPDCFKVLGSSYAKVGGVPVALLGAFAYFCVFTFAIFAAFGYARARTFLIPTIGAMFLATRERVLFSFRRLAQCFWLRFGFCMCRPFCYTPIAAIACSQRQ